MASLIKNQILKHLSKFTKNLSPDKLQLSAIKGSCEVTNIELNEKVLMQLLELPVWLSLTRAYCNYASIKIQWMKLKTIPIYLLLDEVIIDVSTSENFRDEAGSVSVNQFNLQETGSYGFTQKVIDGITLSINSVVIQFNSKIFSASFELTRINIESRNCLWKKTDDLSKTRIRDPLRGQVLIFKLIEWQTLRFVAKSEAKTAVNQAPLRLIANQASCRITLKKRLSDCAVLAARIMLIFDDLLWVLTDSQLLSALHFANYLGDLIKKAPRTKKFDTNNSNHKNATNNNGQQLISKMMNLNSASAKSPNLTANSISLLFSQHDIKETSHHIIIRRIEVHLMDDLGPHNERSQCPDLKDGGALQMSFHRLLIDFYPYHRIDNGSGDRNHWFRYNDPSPHRNSFIMHKLNCFFKRQQSSLRNEGSKFDIESLKSHLISQVLVIRLNDYSIGRVSTNHAAKSRDKNPESSKLIFFDNSTALPGNVPPIYIELNNYFFCEPFDKLNFRMPETNIFAVIAPVKICFDPLTILWVNSFFANLHNAFLQLKEAFPMPENRSQDKPNIRVEILMPTIAMKLDNMTDYNLEYDYIEIKISKIVMYNCDSFISREYFRNLDNLMKTFSSNIDFFYEHSDYPWLSCDNKSISSEFAEKINRLFLENPSQMTNGLSNAYSNEGIDFFALNIEPLWIEIKSSKSSAFGSLLEPVNVSLWIHAKRDDNQNDDPDLNIFARVEDPITVQLTHDQFLFLLRLIEMIGDFTSNLNYDTYMIQCSQYKKQHENSSSVQKFSIDLEEKIIKNIFKNSSFVAHIPEVNLYLMLKEEEEVILSSVPSRCASTIDVDSNDLQLSDKENSSTKNLFVDELSDSNVEELHKEVSSVDDIVVDPGNSINGIERTSSSSDINSLNFNQTVEKHFPKKGFTTSASFDPSNIKIHYAIDNDDALSTISDFSADESDQQSIIALINEESDVLDEILAPHVPVEEAVDILENLNLDQDQVDTLNDLSLENKAKIVDENRTHYIDILHIKIANANIIQQSSKGFLSQVFLNAKLSSMNEHHKLPKKTYLEFIEKIHSENSCDENSDSKKNQLTLRIDSFNKGTLKDELISVYVNDLSHSLNKQTIDMLVDFLNDNITEVVAPMAILLKDLQFKIIDPSVRVPPMVFNVPKLGLGRTKENRWNIEFSIPKDLPIVNYLLQQHLKIFERNLILDVSTLIKEQDRLSGIGKLSYKQDTDTQEILNQVLNQKEILLGEIELLRKENESLRKMMEQNLTNSL